MQDSFQWQKMGLDKIELRITADKGNVSLVWPGRKVCILENYCHDY